MQETSRADGCRIVAYPVMGCLGAEAVLAGAGAVLGYLYPLALILVAIAGVTAGAVVAARRRPRLRNAFALSTMGMCTAMIVIALNHNGPDPILYLTSDVIAVTVGTVGAFMLSHFGVE